MLKLFSFSSSDIESKRMQMYLGGMAKAEISCSFIQVRVSFRRTSLQSPAIVS